MNEQTAFFVSMPFRIGDLQHPHLANKRKPYVIEKTVVLGKIDYENFITDLCVDRQYIEDNVHLCQIHDGIWHCLLIQRRGERDGVLVMSEGCGFPKWAAYYSGEDAGI